MRCACDAPVTQTLTGGATTMSVSDADWLRTRARERDAAWRSISETYTEMSRARGAPTDEQTLRLVMLAERALGRELPDLRTARSVDRMRGLRTILYGAR